MEEKLPKRLNSLRPLFSYRNIYKYILGKFTFGKSFNSSGFTLVEIIVVIMILAVLFVIAIVAINPLKQIQKVTDAQRQNDLKQMSIALDAFYNDNASYPIDIAELDDASKYIQTVPSDPTKSDTYNYFYIVDRSDSLPQWYALFADLDNKDSDKSLCALEKVQANDGCLPQGNRDTNGDLIYNYCVVAGNVDCSYINGLSL